MTSGERHRVRGHGGSLLAACLLALGAAGLAPSCAAAETTGAIAGKVTLASSGAPLGQDQVCAERAGVSGREAAVCVLSDASGEYAIVGLPLGAYEVAFTNNGVECSTHRFDLRYLPQWYDDKPSRPAANLVQIAAPGTVGGIDAAIQTEPRMPDPVDEYLCHEGEAAPVSEGRGTIPGAIEPQQGNQRLREEFWANPTWAQPSTSGSQPCPPPSTPVTPAAPATPAPEPPEEALVACVGAQGLTLATFEHWRRIANSSGGHMSAHETVQEVMDFLISGDWVMGEANDRHIQISAARVQRAFDHLRSQQFRSNRSFRRFLHQSKETVADLLLRTKLQLLAQRIQAQVTAGTHGRQAANRLSRFVEEFRTRWLGATYCAPHYAVPDCGHVQAAL